MDRLLAIEGLAKHFGPIVAVDGVSFAVERGEVLGFLGPNGAGKSTTMRMITGYLAPDAGRVEVCGIELAEDPIEVRRQIGYLPEGAPAYGDMRPAALLDFVARLRRYPAAERRRRVEAVIGRLELEGVIEQPIETLSKGFKRRVGLAVALLHDPEVLILDEPANGLDPQGIRWLRDFLRSMGAEGRTILVSSHVLAEVSQTVDEVVVIHHGRLRANSTLADLTRRREGAAVRVRSPQAENLAELLRVAGGSVQGSDGDLLLVAGISRERVGELAAENRVTLHELAADEADPSLEDVFLQLTTDDETAA